MLSDTIVIIESILDTTATIGKEEKEKEVDDAILKTLTNIESMRMNEKELFG